MTVDQSSPTQRTSSLLEQVGADADGSGEAGVAAEGFRALLDFALERGYLEGLSEVGAFPRPGGDTEATAWVRLRRLPVHPSKLEEYDLLSRWQNVLGTLHAWGHRLVFLLLRHGGETRVYLGAASQKRLVNRRAATGQLWQATLGQMPGLELGVVGEKEAAVDIALSLTELQACGAVTGLPSPRKARGSGLLQTLDQIAFGIRDPIEGEYDYALVVVADPVPDIEIAGAMHTLRALGSEIHSSVKQNISAGESTSETTGETTTTTKGRGISPGMMGGALIGTLANSLIPGSGQLLAGLGMYSGFNLNRSQAEGRTSSRTVGQTHTVGTEQLNKLAQYCEQVTDRHVARLQQGRNLGFWSTGVYVLAQTETAVHTLTGMLRSVYSGDESYLEPIRVHLFNPGSGALNWVKRFQHVPLPSGDENSGGRQADRRDEGWHALGPMYERVATPLNTEELSLTTSLPRRDVPGLRFVRNAVRFANNPPQLEEGADAVTLGRVLDTGVALDREYAFDVNTLVRHALVTGVTGSGKSTTCRRLISEVLDRDVPALIIEPAKDEYVDWALEHNRNVPEEERIRVYVPGGASGHYAGTEVELLRLNPFQPAQVGDRVDLASRCEQFCSVLTASLPMADVLPLLLEESIHEFLYNQIPGFADGEAPAPEKYPRLEGVKGIAKGIIGGRGYEDRIRDNLTAAVQTRIDALTRGRRGQVLNVDQSTPFAELFEKPAVVNLSQINDERDKALIMALLVMALFEYRVSRYRTDPEYQRKAKANRLCHLTVIEEAHRLLANPQTDYANIGNPQGVVSGMFSEMLSEIRAYGQGLMVVDQVPARLIPDAIKNTNLKIVHRLVARDDRAAMAASMALRPDQEDIISALRLGEAIVCGDLDDAASWVKVSRAADD